MTSCTKLSLVQETTRLFDPYFFTIMREIFWAIKTPGRLLVAWCRFCDKASGITKLINSQLWWLYINLYHQSSEYQESYTLFAWWRHQMETFSALLAICAGNSPVPGEFPAQGPVTRSFGVFFDLRLNKRLRKQPWGWWFETLSRPLWRHRNVHFVAVYDGLVQVDLTHILQGYFHKTTTNWLYNQNKTNSAKHRR